MNRATKTHMTSPMFFPNMGMAPFFKVDRVRAGALPGPLPGVTSSAATSRTVDWTTSAPFRVERSGAWVGYEHHDFQGQQFIVERGRVPHWDAYSGSLSYHVERLMSLRPIYCASHQSSRMTIYETENFWAAAWRPGYDLSPALSADEVGPVFCFARTARHTLRVLPVPGYRGQQYIMECERHSGDFQHWKNWGSHCQTPQIQSIRRITTRAGRGGQWEPGGAGRPREGGPAWARVSGWLP
ncbi:unnamed protein product [Arctogadus glacialis]